MRKSFFTPLFAVLTLLTLSLLTLSLVSAQDANTEAAPLSIAFIQNSRVLAAHPAGQAAETLTQQARSELEQIAAQLQPLVAKANGGQTLTPEEQNTLELSQRTYQETQQRYQQEIQTAAQPATEDVNVIVTRVAEEKGYTLVLNRELAASSALIVYGAPSVPDITEEVIQEIQAKYPDASSGGSGN